MLDGNNNSKVLMFRDKYPNFIYHSFEIDDNNEELSIKFHFEIENLKEFFPTIKIVKKKYIKNNIDKNILNNLVFHIGLVEMISYYKATLSKNIIIECGTLSEEQIEFFKKLIFNGLSELMYRNNISLSKDELFDMKFTSDITYSYEDNNEYSGYLIPIGGGKDSIVTLENLPIDLERDLVVSMNPKDPHISCATTRGFNLDRFVEIKRTIDKGIVELNNEGFINGHTPLSALISFITYLVAYLTGKKYIVLSNESSANDANIPGTNVNHQYSKSYEYENDFRKYSNKYLKLNIEYFSFLRGLNEIEITKLFSKYEKYHNIFKSCNLGSKENPWIWCNNCPKCMFVYTILSPFIEEDKLTNIFGENLFNKESLKETFIDLTGNGKLKPFECVGTKEEVGYAVSKTISIYEEKNKELPILLKYYKENFDLVDLNTDLLTTYNNDNNNTKELNEILKESLQDD
ncbi:MAG: hypothetical protein IIZ67_01085 [Bacilli bacterium]|nr:hypothetical protein [Bacilli bacterium]